MPPSIRPDNVILDQLLASMTRDGLVTDVAAISVLRMLMNGVAGTMGELSYDLYTLYRSFLLNLATGMDLDARGSDMGLPRDAGQPAGGPVRFTRELHYREDIVLLAPQSLTPVAVPGTVPATYSTIADAVLQPCGRSVSSEAPSTFLVAGINDQLAVNLDGDGPQHVVMGAQATGEGVALAMQTAIRALFAVDPTRQGAYDLCRVDWNVTTVGAYTVRSGTAGPTSSVVITAGSTADATVALKLGLAQGGTETPGMTELEVPCVCDSIGLQGNLGAGQLTMQRTGAGGIIAVTNPLPFVNGRPIASDEAYRQEVQSYILGLGRGTSDSIEGAIMRVRLADGTQPVQSVQILPDGRSHLQIFVTDARSEAVGAQPEVVEAVQRELDGRGEEAGGWIPSGITALVRPATIRTVTVRVVVTVGLAPDMMLAQRLAVQALYSVLVATSVGETIGYASLMRAIDSVVQDVLRVDFTAPGELAVMPQRDLFVPIGTKLMPGLLDVEVRRG